MSVGVRAQLCILCAQMETGPENWLTALQHLIGGVKAAGFFEILSQECFGTHLKAAVKKVYETTVWFLKVFSRHTYKVGFFVWLVVVCLFFVYLFVFLKHSCWWSNFLHFKYIWSRGLLQKPFLSRKVKKKSEERTYFAQISRRSAIHHFYIWRSLWKGLSMPLW